VSNILGPGQTLKLLEDLGSIVRDLTARAEKLSSDSRTRIARERLRCQAKLDEQTARLSTALVDAESTHRLEVARAGNRYEKRKLWIGKAYQSSRERALENVERKTGTRKYELQKRMLQSERDREAGLTAAAKRRQEFQSALAVEQQRLGGLEAIAIAAFKGYGSLSRLFSAAYENARPDLSPTEDRLLETLRGHIESGTREQDEFNRRFGLRLFRYFFLWALLSLGLLGLPYLLEQLGRSSFTLAHGAAAAFGAMVLIFVLRLFLESWARPIGAKLSASLATARHLHDACLQKSEDRYQAELQRIGDEYAAIAQRVESELKRALADSGEQRVSYRMKSDEKTVRVAATHERLHRARLAALEAGYPAIIESVKARFAAERVALEEAGRQSEGALLKEYEADWQSLSAEWNARLEPIYSAIGASTAEAEHLFPPWTGDEARIWKPPTRFAAAAAFARLELDVARLTDGLPKDRRLALPGPALLPARLSLTYPREGSLLFETTEAGHDEAINCINNTMLRLLASSPAGRLNFTILDPVGLGQNFAGVMHLADYEEQLINNRIWTQGTQIEQKLADLNEHMEKVIQMYLRNEYADIAEYNEQAGVIAEKYHFLVIADFPANFTDTAAKRLLSIAASGARCGVFMLIHWDRRLALPSEFMPDELRKSCFCLTAKGSQWLPFGKVLPGTEITIDVPPSPEVATEFVHHVGKLSKDSSRVEVPFSHVTPSDAELWSEETTSELRVPIGRTGATKLQYLAIGKGTRQHGLIAGKTGSGKSTLFHVIITNLALWCSPDQVEFYLVDFKKGVEFKCYGSMRLPHARVVAIESDREFGLSVLQRVDEELRRRGDLFRKLGVQDIPGYKRAGGTESTPRSLLLIDEFQEFFVEDDKISQTASLLLDRIVRQGRAFGIHVLLGSQTLGGAYTVARTTLGQMVIRIALQCNEADAYLIMDDNNPAPRLLSRPGEGIYNDAAGALEGNSPFQVVWLADHERDEALRKVRRLAEENGKADLGPIVFEGNAPAEVGENPLLERLLETPPAARTLTPRFWLGAPNSIKGPTEVVFQRQSGNHLIIIGQSEEAVQAIFAAGLVALAAQHPPGTARFCFFDGTAPGSPQRAYFERLLPAIQHQVILARQADVASIMTGLAEEQKRRGELADPDEAPATFLLIQGLQKYNRLRYEEDFSFSSSSATDGAPNPANVLNSLISEGARLGFHIIASCDSYNNLTRFLSRKAISEFEMRVLFQMSANDSASLIDSPKASMLGLHRALYFNEQEGYLETFRPYALPGNAWIEQVHASLKRLQPAT
jgi:DNA segregation ATPase FtsK/SpoIIIE, S-DNA-T family